MIKDIRDAFFDTLYKDALIHEDIVIITADTDAFGLMQFKENIPNRFINIGVTEQNMINVAAGMAMRGKKVFVYGIIPFVTMRCFEQIKFNLSGMNLSVTIVGVGTGFSFGFDGPSHHGITDIALMRSIPNMSIYNPCDENSTVASYYDARATVCPSYVRLDKGKFENIYELSEVANKALYNDGYVYPFNMPRYKYLTENRNSEILVLSTGYTTHMIKNYIDNSADVISNVDFIDVYQLKKFPDIPYKNYKHIIVMEEHSHVGSLFTIMSEYVAINGYNIHVHPITALDVEHLIYGDRKCLLNSNNITIDNLSNIIRKCNK